MVSLDGGTTVRALLLFNPNATTTDDRVRDVIAAALRSAVELEVQPTKQRGHATHLAAGAADDRFAAVFVLGGDGTANEVIQALAGTEVLLGVIPGGGANVLARNLGLPNDPVAATGQLLEALRADRVRRIGLGLAGDRYLAFNAGLGFDAAVIRHVEQHAATKRALRQGAFVWSVLREWSVGAGRRDPMIDVHLPDGSAAGPVGVAMVANSAPYTYLGSRPMWIHPDASFDRGLDLLTVADPTSPALLSVALGTFRDGRHVGRSGVGYHRDLPWFELRSAEPQPLMVDGEYAGEHTTVRFSSVPAALRVLV